MSPEKVDKRVWQKLCNAELIEDKFFHTDGEFFLVSGETFYPTFRDTFWQVNFPLKLRIFFLNKEWKKKIICHVLGKIYLARLLPPRLRDFTRIFLFVNFKNKPPILEPVFAKMFKIFFGRQNFLFPSTPTI